MFFKGSIPAQRRIANYGAKVRAYTGTGTAPDYTVPIVQPKLNAKWPAGTAGVWRLVLVPEGSIRSPRCRRHRRPDSGV